MRQGDANPDQAEVVLEWSGALNGETADGHKLHGTEPELRALTAQQRTIRRGRWKLTVDEAGEHELYDLAADPLETRNLLYGTRLDEAPGAHAAASYLWDRLRAWQERTADPLRLPAPL
jgi:arylsulfatase A-like enzyme